MKIVVPCSLCINNPPHDKWHVLISEYFEDGGGHVTCNSGHNVAIVIGSLKFQVIMDSGAAALLQGFTMEACASFAAARERFIEFCLSIFSASMGLDRNVSGQVWKSMSKHSERQMGAFYFSYAAAIGEKYDEKSIKKEGMDVIEFRNKIIHSGYIPNNSEATKFCKIIYEDMYKIFNTIKAKYDSHIINQIWSEHDEKCKMVQEGFSTVSYSGSSIFEISDPNLASSFEEAISRYERFLEMKRVFEGHRPGVCP